MTDERDKISKNTVPRTRESLGNDLLAMGLKPGMTVLVHVSLSQLGWVCGAGVAVIQALRDALGPSGTLMFPSHTGDISDPAQWSNPPVPKEWVETIRQHMPPFDKALSPTLSIGRIPELFRHQPGVLRSSHPEVSFAAEGPNARALIEDHELDNGMGEGSPLARLYDLDGWILLLGVDHSVNTSLHLSEYRSGTRKKVKRGAAMTRDGKRQWVWYDDEDTDSDDFAEIGKDFERLHPDKVILGNVGSGVGRLMKQRDAVDFAVGWMKERYS